LLQARRSSNRESCNRNIVLGVFGLDVIDSPVHEAALNEELIPLKIEVVPLKRRDLAHAKTEALGDHTIVRYGSGSSLRPNGFKLVHSQS
jgi:hypothetical protein